MLGTVGRLEKIIQPLGIIAHTVHREAGGRVRPARGRGTPTLTRVESRFAFIAKS